MVAVVNSVVVAACAGLVLEAAGVDSLAMPSERSSEPPPSRCTNATTAMRATPIPQKLSIGPPSSPPVQQDDAA
jgi:hypothetical protein